MKRTLLAAALALSLAAHAPAQSPSAGDNMTLTAIDGIKVGHFTLAERPTGCTVVLVEAGATGGVEVSGGAPATRDTDLLSPTKMVEQIYGIALSGGSLFGLSTGDGVLRYLEDKGVGIVYGNRHIPIVPGASIFDLGVGDGRIRPTADCGRNERDAQGFRPSADRGGPLPAAAVADRAGCLPLLHLRAADDKRGTAAALDQHADAQALVANRGEHADDEGLHRASVRHGVVLPPLDRFHFTYEKGPAAGAGHGHNGG